MREAVRVWRGVRGLEKWRVCGGCLIGTGCGFVRWKFDLDVRAEDGRKSGRRGLVFMLKRGEGVLEGTCKSID